MSTEQLDQHSLIAGRTFPWHEVYVPDDDAAVKFYTEALGFGTMEFDMGSGSPYKMLTVNGAPVAGIQSTNNPQMADTPPHWAVYLGVDDVDGRVAACVALGAEVVVPAMDVPTVGRMAMIKDPQGACLWLYKSSHG